MSCSHTKKELPDLADLAELACSFCSSCSKQFVLTHCPRRSTTSNLSSMLAIKSPKTVSLVADRQSQASTACSRLASPDHHFNLST